MSNCEENKRHLRETEISYIEKFGGLEEHAGLPGIASALVKTHHRGWKRNLGRKGKGRLVLSRQDSDFCLFNENYEAELSFLLTLK